MFTAKLLRGGDAPIAYPLVACRHPDLSLARWLDFVARCDAPGSPDRLVGLVDSRGRFHGVFAWRIDRTPPAPGFLRVAHIATFQLVGNAVHRAFHEALDVIARDNDCRETVIDPWAPPSDSVCASRVGEPDGHGGQVLTIAPAAESAQTLN